MIEPTSDDLLGAVVDAVEREIAPACADDDYAASLCRTVAQMLRSVRVRIRVEQAALDEDNAELRVLLAGQDGLPTEVAEQVRRAVAAEPAATHAPLCELQSDAQRLRAALAAVIDALPDEDHPTRSAARDYLARQLGREREWQQDAFTGPRR